MRSISARVCRRGSRSPRPRPSLRRRSTAPYAPASPTPSRARGRPRRSPRRPAAKSSSRPGEEGRERAILDHLLRTATAQTAREPLRGMGSSWPRRGPADGHLVLTGSQVWRATSSPLCPFSASESKLYDEVANRVGATTPVNARARSNSPRGPFLAEANRQAMPMDPRRGVWRVAGMTRRDLPRSLWRAVCRGDLLVSGRSGEALAAIGDDVMAGYPRAGPSRVVPPRQRASTWT